MHVDSELGKLWTILEYIPSYAGGHRHALYSIILERTVKVETAMQQAKRVKFTISNLEEETNTLIQQNYGVKGHSEKKEDIGLKIDDIRAYVDEEGKVHFFIGTGGASAEQTKKCMINLYKCIPCKF